MMILMFYSNYGSISRVVPEILNVEKWRDLEIRLRVHSRSLKVAPFDKLGMVSCYSVL